MEFLRGKTAIVTGAAGGIGEAICKKLADLGMNLVITGRKAQALEELAAQLPTKVCCCVGDLQELAFVDRLLADARETFGGVDVIINNAGLSHNCTVEEMTPELFDSIMQVNVRAPYFLCQKAVEDLKNPAAQRLSTSAPWWLIRAIPARVCTPPASTPCWDFPSPLPTSITRTASVSM